MKTKTSDSINTSALSKTAGRDRAGGSAKFRTEVLEKRSNQWLGKTTLALPLSFAVYSTSALSLAAVIVAFLIFGSYAQTETVSAVITPEGGPAKVFSTTSGTIAVEHVHEGDLVSQGAPLFSIRKLQESSPTSAVASIPDSRASNSNTFEIIKAPVSGRVYALAKHTGDDVSSYGTEPIATIAADNALEVVAKVTSAVQARVNTGTPVQVELDAFKGRPRGRLSARVTVVAAEPTEDFDLMSGGMKRSYKVVLRIDSSALTYPRHELLGKAVQVKFMLEKRKLYQWLLDPLQTLFDNYN